MKTYLRMLCTGVSAMLCCMAAPVLPAAADVAEPPVPEVVAVPSLYEDYEPVGRDVLMVLVPQNEQCRVTVTQHSPERENLLLFDAMLAPESRNEVYEFALEPGDYTLSLSAPIVAGTARMQNGTIDLTVENSDFSGGAFDQTQIGIQASFAAVTGNDDAAAVITADEPEIKVSAKTVLYHAVFPRYQAMRGDFDGDSDVDADDAQGTLITYLMRLANKADQITATAEHQAVCDIDADSALTADDAQYILAYYLNDLAHTPVSWDALLHPAQTPAA